MQREITKMEIVEDCAAKINDVNTEIAYLFNRYFNNLRFPDELRQNWDEVRTRFTIVMHLLDYESETLSTLFGVQRDYTMKLIEKLADPNISNPWAK